jgi:hypothetical protein
MVSSSGTVCGEVFLSERGDESTLPAFLWGCFGTFWISIGEILRRSSGGGACSSDDNFIF